MAGEAFSLSWKQNVHYETRKSSILVCDVAHILLHIILQTANHILINNVEAEFWSATG